MVVVDEGATIAGKARIIGSMYVVVIDALTHQMLCRHLQCEADRPVLFPSSILGFCKFSNLGRLAT